MQIAKTSGVHNFVPGVSKGKHFPPAIHGCKKMGGDQHRICTGMQGLVNRVLIVGANACILFGLQRSCDRSLQWAWSTGSRIPCCMSLFSSTSILGQKWYSPNLQAERCNIWVESKLHPWSTVITPFPIENRSKFLNYDFAQIIWLADMFPPGNSDTQW